MEETYYQKTRREDFIKYMEKCFGKRWFATVDKGKTKMFKRVYYAGYNKGSA